MEHPARAWTGHPLWLVGFRPFFPLAALAAATLPAAWVFIYTGLLAAPTALPPLHWHAYELFFGFGFTVLAGFLLTATKNWTHSRGAYGPVLQLLVGAWLVERLGLWFSAHLPTALFLGSQLLFTALLVGVVIRTLVKGRSVDTFRDNPIFVVVMPLFVAARVLMLDAGHFATGRDLTVALFRVMFVVMLERTVPQFLKGAWKVEVPRVAAVDHALKGLALLLLAGPWLPTLVRQGAAGLLAVLMVGRFASWALLKALRRLELAVMVLGGVALSVHAVLEAFAVTWLLSGALHVFTMGTMGLIIPGMLLRIAKGHTGRPVAFEAIDRFVLWLAVVAFVTRVVAVPLWPALLVPWLWASALAWTVAFGLVFVRITPLLLAERVDGREH